MKKFKLFPILVAKYRFCGWFPNTGFAVQWNTAQDVVNGNMTLYAKWEENE